MCDVGRSYKIPYKIPVLKSHDQMMLSWANQRLHQFEGSWKKLEKIYCITVVTEITESGIQSSKCITNLADEEELI